MSTRLEEAQNHHGMGLGLATYTNGGATTILAMGEGKTEVENINEWLKWDGK